MGVQRCSDLEVDFIFSQIDDDWDGEISEIEFLNNYWLIIQLLQKNKKMTKKEKEKSGGDFFRNQLHKHYKVKDPEQKHFMEFLVEECKKYQKLDKKKTEKIRFFKQESLI